MTICMVKGCRNRISRKNFKQDVLEETTKLTFHMFPKKWYETPIMVNSLELDESSLPKYSMVCLVHFKSEDFERTSLSCTRYTLRKIQGKEPAKNTRKYQRMRVHLFLYVSVVTFGVKARDQVRMSCVHKGTSCVTTEDIPFTDKTRTAEGCSKNEEEVSHELRGLKQKHRCTKKLQTLKQCCNY